MKRLVCFMICWMQLAFGQSLDEIYQEGIALGAEYNETTLIEILSTDTSHIDLNHPSFVDENALTDPQSSKEYALQQPGVKEQISAAQQLHDKLETPEMSVLQQAAMITEHPETFLSQSGEAYCQDGGCSETDSADHSASMIPATAILNDVLGGGVSSSTSPDYSIYGGTSRTCRAGDELGVSADCCKEKGLWLNLHIQECEKEEEELADLKEQLLCHDVGKYTKKKHFIKHYYRTYCCFPTKMARVTQEQAKKTQQLGLNWGRAKYPNCRGFTQDQFASLNFEIMDLTEIETDIEQKMKEPDPNEMLKKPEQYIQEQGIQSW